MTHSASSQYASRSNVNLKNRRMLDGPARTLTPEMQHRQCCRRQNDSQDEAHERSADNVNSNVRDDPERGLPAPGRPCCRDHHDEGDPAGYSRAFCWPTPQSGPRDTVRTGVDIRAPEDQQCDRSESDKHGKRAKRRRQWSRRGRAHRLRRVIKIGRERCRHEQGEHTIQRSCLPLRLQPPRCVVRCKAGSHESYLNEWMIAPDECSTEVS